MCLQIEIQVIISYQLEASLEPMKNYYYHSRITRDLTNFSLFKHRNAFKHCIISMHNSGTHWVRYMIMLALKYHYDLPEINALTTIDDFFDPRIQPRYKHIPRIGSTHQIPNPLLTLPFIHKLTVWPNYLILVRDPRYSLVANYHKTKDAYQMSFSEYLRADVKLLRKRTGKKRFVTDICWILRFMNSWAHMIDNVPGETKVIKYEDLRKNTEEMLAMMLDFLQVPVTDKMIIARCVTESSKEKMSKIADQRRTVVRKDDPDPLAIYSESDKEFLIDTFDKFAFSTFGYDFRSGW